MANKLDRWKMIRRAIIETTGLLLCFAMIYAWWVLLEAVQ